MFKHLLKIAIGNFFSKGLGFLREILIAWWYGTSYYADAYRIAQTAIFLPTSFIMGNAFESAFVPNMRENESKNKGNAFLKSVSIMMILISFLLVLMFMTTGETFLKTLAPGFSEKTLLIATDLVLIMALAIPLYIFSYILIYFLNSINKYGFGSMSSIIQNILLIASLFLSYILKNFLLIGFGFLLTYAICSILIIKSISKSNSLEFGALLKEKIDYSILGAFVKTIAPLLFFMLFYQTNIFVERFFTSKVGVGAVAAIDYAKTLFETPTFLIVIPLATISLTYLSGKKWSAETKTYIEVSLLRILMILLPIAIIFFFEGQGIVKILFMRGKFDEKSLELTTNALKGLSLGLWALGINIFMQRAYNALNKGKKFVYISIFSILINISLNFIIFNFTKLGVFGVSFSFSVSVIIQTILLTANLRLDFKKIVPLMISITGAIISISLLDKILIGSLNYNITVLFKSILVIFIFFIVYLMHSITREQFKALLQIRRKDTKKQLEI